MPFSWLPASNLFRIPQLQGESPEIHFGDAFGTPTEGNLTNPLTGFPFFLTPNNSPQPAPTYEYDKTGVVLEGTLALSDENGKKGTAAKRRYILHQSWKHNSFHHAKVCGTI